MVTGKSKRILFIGDLNVDILMGGLAQFPVPDREITCETFEITIGSAAAICACAYASLGGDAAFCGLAGSDQYGEYMIKGLRSFGINTDLIERSDAVATGVTVNLIESGRRTQVTYPGTIAAFDGHQLNSSIVGRFDHIHIAGPYQQTTFRPRITEFLKPCRGQSVTTSLDPQWDQTERWEYADDWLPLLDYLFLNQDEAASVSGLNDPREACAALAERTACPVVKAGKEGSFISLDHRVRLIPTRPVQPVDTTGAGDSFNAGFLFSRLERGGDLASAARFGNALGARSCLFSGGVNARTKVPDVEAFLKRPVTSRERPAINEPC